MFGLVIAACLFVPETTIAPSHQVCSLMIAHDRYKTPKECEIASKLFIANATKGNKLLKINTHKCVDMKNLELTPAPPPTNQVDPKLKPVTPEQENNGYKSL